MNESSRGTSKTCFLFCHVKKALCVRLICSRLLQNVVHAIHLSDCSDVLNENQVLKQSSSIFYRLLNLFCTNFNNIYNK